MLARGSCDRLRTMNSNVPSTAHLGCPGRTRPCPLRAALAGPLLTGLARKDGGTARRLSRPGRHRERGLSPGQVRAVTSQRCRSSTSAPSPASRCGDSQEAGLGAVRGRRERPKGKSLARRGWRVPSLHGGAPPRPSRAQQGAGSRSPCLCLARGAEMPPREANHL